MFPVWWVVRVPPDLGVDVLLFEPVVVGGEIPTQLFPVGVRVVAVRVRPPERLQHVRLRADLVDRHPVHLLGGHVLWLGRNEHPVDEPLRRPVEHHGTLHEFVAVECDHPALDGLTQLVTGTTDPLEQRRDGLGGADLDDQVQVWHVDPQLQRGRGGDHVHVAGLQVLLDGLALVFRHRAVVTPGVGLVVGVEPAPEGLQHAFRARPRVCEDEGVVVAPDEVVEAVVEPVVDHVPRGVDQVVGGALQLEVELPDEPGVDDLVVAEVVRVGVVSGRLVCTAVVSVRRARLVCVRLTGTAGTHGVATRLPADEELRDRRQGFDGRRTPDPSG